MKFKTQWKATEDAAMENTSYREALEQEPANTGSELRVAEELVAQERLKNRQSTERDMVESQCH